MPQNDHVLIGGLAEEDGRLCHQRVEPAAGLINRLRDEVRGELLLELVLILEGIVMLGIGHSAGVEPDVHNLGDTVHGLSAVRAGEGHPVDIGAVQLNVCHGGISCPLDQFGARPDAFLVTAVVALPDIQGSSPVAVAGNAPILDILQPVAESPLTD